MNRSYDVITFILKYLYLKKSIIANFADIIKIIAIFVKTIFKDFELNKLYLKMQSISVFRDIAKFADFQ